jgi:hypothetical protein
LNKLSGILSAPVFKSSVSKYKWRLNKRAARWHFYSIANPVNSTTIDGPEDKPKIADSGETYAGSKRF